MHDVPNIFITDGSFMASSATANPSLTYMAFTARAVDYAVAQMKKGNLQLPFVFHSYNYGHFDMAAAIVFPMSAGLSTT